MVCLVSTSWNRIRRHRWQCVAFDEPLPLTVENIVKLAKATDPRASSFAIHYSEKTGLVLWGLVDQGTKTHQFVTFEAEGGFARPGVFHATVAGLGHLIVWEKIWKIAELRVNTLITGNLDVFQFGPISDFVNASVTAPTKRIIEQNIEGVSDAEAVLSRMNFHYTRTLCRLLQRIQTYRHGGALLINTNGNDDLLIKHRIDYPRLATSMEHYVAQRLKKDAVREEIFENYRKTDEPFVPTDLYVRETSAEHELEDTDVEVDGAIWFVSLLTRVDGAVLLDRELRVAGFGTEIRTAAAPSAVYLSTNASGTVRGQRKIDYEHYGTRHRSMMRFCNAHPGSMGFVISQDGDVRVIFKVGKRLVMWDNIKLDLTGFGGNITKTKAAT